MHYSVVLKTYDMLASRSRSMYQITFMNGLISSLATSSKVQQPSKHSMSSITARTKVMLNSSLNVQLSLTVMTMSTERFHGVP